MILIGSRAYAFNYKDYKRVSSASDYDVIMSNTEFKNWFNTYKKFIISSIPSSEDKYKIILEKDEKRISYEIEIGNDTGKSHDFLLNNTNFVTIAESVYKGFLGEDFLVLSGPYLGITKKSHITYPIHFEKNIIDYQNICAFENRNFMVDNLNELELEYYNLRSNEVSERSPQKTPKLNVSTEDFFSSKLPVPSYFVHDDLHALMAHRDKPIFEMMQRDNSKAWCEKDMFFALPYEYRLEAVVEEAYVIAMERYIIPQHGNNVKDHFECFKNAVKRICTTLTSGWFREFAVVNYNNVIKKYDDKFALKFINAYEKGLIKPKDEFKESEIPFIVELKKLNILT